VTVRFAVRVAASGCGREWLYGRVAEADRQRR